jgi:septal ring factor EnvC (AmiA/AmiB activator)
MHCAKTPSAEPGWSSPRRRGRWMAVLLVTLLALTTSDAQTTTRNADLERMRDEIGKLKSKLEEVRRQARSAEQQLEEVDLELGIRSRELEIALDLERRLEEERHSISLQIADLTPRIDQQKKYLAKRLVALYRFGGLSYLRMFLSIDQRRDPIEAMSMLSYLVGRDSRAVAHFQSARQQLSVRYFDLADREKRLQQMKRVVEDRRRAVTLAHDEQARLLSSLRTEESGSARQLADLEEKARRLERLVSTLSKQQTLGAGAVADIRGVQGALAWPVDGKVIERFGRQRNAKFSTWTNNNGVKISAPAGAPVRAVYQGTVLFSQWFKGYGNLIILDHGHRVFSLYGNVKTPSVNIGDRVMMGQPIAGVGESEESPPGHLYFEIRQDNRPEDPQKWLR